MRQWVIETTLAWYRFLLPIAWVAFGIAVVVLLPLAAWRRTRASAAKWLLTCSYLIGLTTWFLGVGVTFAAFGWLGLAIGLVVLGVGVVPLGIIGAFFKLDINSLAISLIVLSIITFAMRFVSVYFSDNADA